MKHEYLREHQLQRIGLMSISGGLMTAVLLSTSCNPKEPPRAAFVPVGTVGADLWSAYFRGQLADTQPEWDGGSFGAVPGG